MINTTQTVQPYTFTPGAPPATFNIPFGYQIMSEINVTLSQSGLPNISLVWNVDFTVTSPSPTGGTLTKVTDWGALYPAYGTATLFRYTAKINATSVVNGGGIDATVLEYVIDELTQMIQEGSGASVPTSGYAFTFPISDPPGLGYVAPAVAARALMAAMFDAAGNVVAGLPSAAPINAVWQAGLAQNQIIALQIAFGLIPAGSTIDKMQFDMENRHAIGEYIWLDDYRAPSQYAAATPSNHWAGLFLGNGDQTITAAHWPLGVTHMRSIPVAYQRGQAGEVTGFAASGWVLNTNVVTVTFTNTTAENAILAALAEELLVHGNTFTGWRTITVPSLGGIVPAGDYAITGLSTGSRTITFAYTAANNSGGAFTANFYAYRIAGSTITALVYKANGATLSNVSDSDEETPYSQLNEKIIGLRKRSRGQGHWHTLRVKKFGAGTGAVQTIDIDGTADTSYISGTTTHVDAPLTDGTNGTPRIGKTTEMRQIGAALFIWLGRFVA